MVSIVTASHISGQSTPECVSAASFGLRGPGDFGIFRFDFIVLLPLDRSNFITRKYSLVWRFY